MKRSAPTQSSQNRNTSASNVRLMVHAIDGTIPYLTPRLLHTCFPPEKKPFIVGVAVRDTCVVALSSVAAQQKIGSTGRGQKPQRGKAFSSEDSCVDNALQSYERFVVPTFDPHSDATQTGVLPTSKAPILELAVKRNGSDTSFIYTSSGRHRLSAKQYADCAIDALGARWMLPLYDVLPSTAEQYRVEEHTDMLEKRRSMCASNNQHWTQLAVDACAARNTAESTDKRSPSIWAPWACGQQTDSPRLSEHLANTTGVEGVTVIGWNSIVEAKERERVLHEMKQSLVAESTKMPLLVPEVVCFLCTDSLQQVRELLQFASSLEDGMASSSSSSREKVPTVVIGTSLPRQWALAKRAFVDSPPPATDASHDAARRTKQAKKSEELKDPSDELMIDDDGCLDLHPPKNGDPHPWARDTRPILEGCTCVTCQTHSRAYLHHLVRSKEILAEIMLFIHNLHHLLQVTGQTAQRRL